MESIVDARQTLFDKLTPTLRREVEATLDKLYGDVRQKATLAMRKYGELGAIQRLPQTCPYSWDEICRQDRYPIPAKPPTEGEPA